MTGITTARYFLIRKRPDGVVAFWYKPQVAHAWLYPSKKGATGEPEFTNVNGERHYDIVCEDGIEIFHSATGPSGAPPLAEFPINKSTQLPYLDVDTCYNAVANMVKQLPEMFGTDGLEPWDKFKAEHPRKCVRFWSLVPLPSTHSPLPVAL
jgi:hypothetical protein